MPEEKPGDEGNVTLSHVPQESCGEGGYTRPLHQHDLSEKVLRQNFGAVYGDRIYGMNGNNMWTS